jgi:hypothetical protein
LIPADNYSGSFAIYAKARISGISANQAFFDNLGLSDQFIYTDYSIGLRLLNQFTIGYYSTHIVQKEQVFSSYVSVQFTPNKNK